MSLLRKIIAVTVFVALCEVTILDSTRFRQTELPQMAGAVTSDPRLEPSPDHDRSAGVLATSGWFAPQTPGRTTSLFRASAYCKGQVTSSGVAVQTGIAASDPELLPVGSVVQIESLGVPYDGVYTVLDTGPSVRGREIDLYMWSCNEALAFGRRSARVRVLRFGWNPRSARK